MLKKRRPTASQKGQAPCSLLRPGFSAAMRSEKRSANWAMNISRPRDSSCGASDWAAITGVACGPGGFCTDQLNPATRQLSDEVFQLGMVTTGAAGSFAEAAADMCFEPTGTSLWRAGAAVGANLLMSSSNAGAGGNLSGGFLIRVQRLDLNGDPLSPDRFLTVPLGAAARVAR